MFDNIIYPSAEHAFQAARTTDSEERKQILETRDAKAAGRTATQRENWDNIRFAVMQQIVYDKFTRNAPLRNKLLYTGNAPIILNDNDNFGNRQGWKTNENQLGDIVMYVRERIQKEETSNRTPKQSTNKYQSLLREYI